MEWLVRGARPNDSLFFHCAWIFHVISICFYLPKQTPVTEDRPRTSMAMKKMGMMKVIITGCQSKACADFHATVIYPVDFKQNGHIVDDVRLHFIPCQAAFTDPPPYR